MMSAICFYDCVLYTLKNTDRESIFLSGHFMWKDGCETHGNVEREKRINSTKFKPKFLKKVAKKC